MDFEKICMMFTMQEPFYGILLSAMNKEPCTQHPSIGVGISGNVFKLTYNPDWLNNLPVDTQLELLKHEILHLAFNHPTMWTREEEMDPAMHDLHNQACDYEVNCYIDRTKIPKEIGGCFVEDKSWDKCLGAKEYFARLLKEYQSQPQQQNVKNPNKPCNGGGGESEQNNQDQNDSTSQDNQSNGQQQDNNQQQPNSDTDGNGHSNSFDSHQEWSQFKENDTAQGATDMIESLLEMAANECEKSQGTVPAEMEQLIERIRTRKPKPVADWKRYCRRYLGNEFSELFRKSKKRESKRFPDAAGTRHQRKSNILVAIDTSGSVSMPEYNEFFGQIKTMCATANFHVVECDATIQHEYDFRGKIHETVHGGGGTSFEPVIDYYIQHKRKYDALVYFTDGCAPIPNNTPKDTLWVISSKGNHDRERYKINGASVAIIPPQPVK
jgi:predicted metal-dependent peptidase